MHFNVFFRTLVARAGKPFKNAGKRLKVGERINEVKHFGRTLHAPPVEIMKNLEINASDLSGKTVLNLGEGRGKFKKFCEENFGAKYYGLDAKKLLRRIGKTSVIALASEIPFKSNSFDVVLDHYACLFRADFDTQKKIVTEALRVGREFISYPISVYPANASRLVEWLQDNGFEVKFGANRYLIKVVKKGLK